ncbi:NUMOD3 domain-containing DNA-binding protein [Enterobacter hormaechei]|uniref:NUMOD3 domain-containing DNA-binding protein n=1 Tax=Enterobacter hormaechei TaxID=158836 RepID=UPI00069AF62A|nr:NUMOD3 domain-containing DNA-binding protein [Enterobacter hormaechei]HDF7628637.1 hypothetical protein [Enterobacter hormaechei]
MHHFVYHTVITKNETGRVLHYIGKHSTENLNDGYVGSGKRIKQILSKEKSNPGTYKIECTRSKFFESSDEAYYFEELAISEARSKFGKKNVLNISDGGLAPLLRGENHPMFGTSLSEETKKKIADFNLGKKASKETRHKMSITRTGLKRKPHSTSTKLKMSQLKLGIKTGPRSDSTKLKISEVQRNLPHWNYFDELFNLWVVNQKLGHRRFAKIAVENGYPDVSYTRMVENFKAKATQ